MKWMEITVHTTTFGSELVADAFFEMGASGVVVSDTKDILQALESNKMWDYVDDDLLSNQSDIVLVKAFVTQDIFSESLVTANERISILKEREQEEFPLGSLEIITREIDDEDWMNVWKKHYRPIPVRNIVICPEWIDYKKSGEEEVVLIQPGMAFGTGEHETTSMCIDLMQDYSLHGKDVFDVGCGSGILGLSALKLGAKSCLMVDFDPQAVQAARYNAELNGLLNIAEIHEGDLLSSVTKKADVIFANITADILKRLCTSLATTLKKGGIVVLSGIIHSRKEDVIAEYIACNFTIIREKTMGEWNGVSLHYGG